MVKRPISNITDNFVGSISEIISQCLEEVITITTRVRERVNANETTSAYWRTYFYVTGGAASVGWVESLDYIRLDPRPSFASVYDWERTTDEVIPNFHTRRKKGEIFNNPYTHEEVSIMRIPTTGTVFGAIGNGTYPAYDVYEPGPDLFLTPSISFQEKINHAVKISSTQALARVTSEEMLMLATLGELKESKEMIINACRRLKDLRRTFVKMRDFYRVFFTNLGNTKQRVKDMGKQYLVLENIWMELRMGWRPFYGECRNIVGLFEKKKKRPERHTFRAKVIALKESRDAVNLRGSSSSWSVSTQQHFEIEAKIRSGVLCKQRPHGFADVLGLTKIPQTIWELTKLSWCIDYFFNTAEVIAAYTPDTLWEPLAAWTTVETSTVASDRITSVGHPDLDTSQLKCGMNVKTTRRKDRFVGSSIGLTFRPRMNVAKYLDVIAVTRQQVTPIVKEIVRLARKRK